MIEIIKFHLYKGEFSRRIQRRHRILWQQTKPLQSMQLTQNDPQHEWVKEPLWQRRLSHKLHAKTFAQLSGCKTATLYWEGRDVQQIDFSSLPSQYVIRPTRGSGCTGVFVMRDGLNLFDNKRYSSDEMIQLLETCVAAFPDQHILVEEFLQNEAGEYEIPVDYKFFCFNGKIAGLSVVKRLSPHTGTCSFFNEHWIPITPLTLAYPYPYKNGQMKPKCFEEMVEQVKKLSKIYGMFVRLDFYATPKGPVFGEFTPTPGMGKGYTRFAEKFFTSYWDTYCAGQI